jgi:hypothetical protein
MFAKFASLIHTAFACCVGVILMPMQAYAHEWCGGADGVYAEDLIQRLEARRATAKDPVLLERMQASLRTWLEVNKRIGQMAGFENRLFICKLPGLNAFVTTKSEPIRIHSQTIEIFTAVGAEKDVLAALLGHEYSHLALNHAAQKIVAHQAVRDWAVRAGQAVLKNTWDVAKAKDVAVSLYKGEMSAFSIKHELEADDFGISLVGKAGYRPSSFFGLAAIGKALYGESIRDAFPSHPGFVERMLKGEDRVIDESFDQAAAGFRENGDFGAIANLVRDWVARLPSSGNVWYYKAVLLRQMKRPATEAMEEALLPTSRPSMRQRDGDTKEALLWLCVQLYKEGYSVESAWCGETFLRRDEELWARFGRQTFRDRLWIGMGNSVDDAGGTINLKFVRKPNGERLITNVPATAAYYGIDESQVTPAWRPVRFKACVSTKVKSCPVRSVDTAQPLADNAGIGDQLADVRKNCRPPNCVIH